jgi:tRNA dimethylallyltransferase
LWEKGQLVKANLVVLVGPTAVGKTALSVRLAKKWKADIFSADSRQLYKEMSIGTAKPTPKEMEGVKHHFIDSHSIAQNFTAGDFERQLDKKLEEYFQGNTTGILSGGTGLFVKAALYGLDDMPEAPQQLRDELMNRLKTEGLETLQKELQVLDPEGSKRIEIQNPQRVVRALEVCLSTGKPFSSFQTGAGKVLPYHPIKIGIERDREELYSRINQRVDLMIQQGLLDEVKRLLPYRNSYALQTVGYKEIFDFIDGKTSWEESVELLKRNTRRYAKRQLTWFKNQDQFSWFHADDEEGINEYIEKSLLHK